VDKSAGAKGHTKQLKRINVVKTPCGAKRVHLLPPPSELQVVLALDVEGARRQAPALRPGAPQRVRLRASLASRPLSCKRCASSYLALAYLVAPLQCWPLAAPETRLWMRGQPLHRRRNTPPQPLLRTRPANYSAVAPCDIVTGVVHRGETSLATGCSITALDRRISHRVLAKCSLLQWRPSLVSF